MVPQIKNGILNIDKPQGITSHDVVSMIRKVFPNMKVGHTGTLDPLATGVLPVCIGKATKLTDYLVSTSKKYFVKMILGVETDTYDIEGKIVFASVLNKDEIYIKERIKRFIGKQMQIPPQYSAIKINGKKAYEYAREGKKIELNPREVEIYDINNINVDIANREVSFSVDCSKGTYVRSLVHDIGVKLGCGATMTELRRLRTGDFDIANSIKLYDFLELDYLEMLNKIVSIEDFYKECKKVNFTKEEFEKFENAIIFDYNMPDGLVRVYCEYKFKGIGIVRDNRLKRFIIE